MMTGMERFPGGSSGAKASPSAEACCRLSSSTTAGSAACSPAPHCSAMLVRYARSSLPDLRSTLRKQVGLDMVRLFTRLF